MFYLALGKDFQVAHDKQDGAFDEAVKGMDAIAHIASPLHFNSEDPSGKQIRYIWSLLS